MPDHDDPAAAQADVAALPRARAERIVSLDLIRGIAVLGILLANIVAFGQPDIAIFWPPGITGGDTYSDGVVWLVQLVFVDGKLRGLFTVLFGASMLLFLDRFEERGDAAVLQLRRLLWLAVFGLLHFALFFEGDILFAYALAGFVVLFASGLEARALLALGIGGAVLGGAMRMSDFGTGAALEVDRRLASVSPDAVQVFADYWQGRLSRAEAQAEVWTGGSWLDVVQYRVVEDGQTLLAYFTFNFYETIPLMLVGMGLYRAGLFTRERGPTPLMRHLAVIGIAAAAFLHLSAGLWVMQRGFPVFSSQFVFLGLLQVTNVPMILGYIVLLCAFAPRLAGGWLGRRLVAAGRTAFTNYVGTSVVMSIVFQGWALGLYGKLHRVELLAVVLAAWVVMLTWPTPWLRRYRQGPLEYLWRCLTYWRLFPNRA